MHPICNPRGMTVRLSRDIHKHLFIPTILIIINLFPSILYAQNNTNADVLLSKVDHVQVSQTSHSIGTITVSDRFGSKVSAFEAWAAGSDKSLISFSAGDEKGQKILRLGNTIYVAYPEADKPVKIQGAALRDSVAGSDFSYEDMTAERGLANRYTAKITGNDDIAGTPCTKMELSAKQAGLAFPFLIIWVNTNDFSVRKTEKYTQNKRLLKTEEILAVKTIAGKTIPVKIMMTDHLKGKSKTVIDLSTMEIDVKIEARKLSLEELTW